MRSKLHYSARLVNNKTTCYNGPVKKAVAYIRVSTGEQQLGPQAQRAAIEDWAKREKVKITSWCEDIGVSGATPLDRRPGLARALLAVKKADYLVAAKRDRFARDGLIAKLLDRAVRKAGAQMATADGVGAGDGPEAQLLVGILDAVAEYERLLIKSRITAALAVKKARGEAIGGTPPFGWKRQGKVWVEDEEEQATIAFILELDDAGLPHRAIADELNASAFAPRGKSWHPTTVARILTRAREQE